MHVSYKSFRGDKSDGFGTSILLGAGGVYCTGYDIQQPSPFYFPATGQALVTGVVPSASRFLPSIFIAHRVQQSHCSSSFHRMLLTHALAFSASQIVHKKKSPRIHTSMHSGGFELTKLTHTRLEDNLMRHRGDRITPRVVSRTILGCRSIKSSLLALERLDANSTGCICYCRSAIIR